jgi:hypothetical protein
MSTRVPHRSPSVNFVVQPTNRRPLDFEAQTKKPPRWFSDPNYQTGAAGFETQTRKPEATNFEAKLGETVATGFDAKPGETINLVLRLNQETRAPRLHVHGTYHTRCHPTSWSPGHWVPDLCLTILGPLQQVSYSCHDPRRCPPCHTYYLHTTRQANKIPHTNQRIKEKLSKCPRFKFKPQHVNDSSYIKPRYWPLGFSISPLMSPLTKNHKFESQIQDPMKHS